MEVDWINLGAITALGVLLWRVMVHKFNDAEKNLDALNRRLSGRMDKLDEGLADANTKLANLTGELRGRRAVESEVQMKAILENIAGGKSGTTS